MQRSSPSSKDGTNKPEAGDSEESSTPSTKKKFTQAEDQCLSYLVSIHGLNNWKRIAWNMPGRSVRQCRERWKYYLEPNINHQVWTKEEDRLLIAKFQELGPSWARMTNFFRNRTDIDLKNRYHRLERSIKRTERELNSQMARVTSPSKSSDHPLRTFRMAEVPRDHEVAPTLDLVNHGNAGQDQRASVAPPPKSYDLEQMSIDNLLNK